MSNVFRIERLTDKNYPYYILQLRGHMMEKEYYSAIRSPWTGPVPERPAADASAALQRQWADYQEFVRKDERALAAMLQTVSPAQSH